MSVTYTGISWNRQKRRYDAMIALAVAGALASFGAVTALLRPQATIETIVIRSTAITALILLHVVLATGPLARLDRRFLPLLYNRRHLGVVTFALGLVHATFAIVQFHALGDVNPLVSAFTAYAGDRGLPNIPFESFGAAALVVLFLMAATSHDFWLKTLGAPAWKALHLAVFAAYGSLLAHVAWGALQSERSVVPAALLSLGAASLLTLHLLAAQREARTDRGATEAGFVRVARFEDLAEGRGCVVVAGGMRIALWRKGDRVHATSNACRHQGGPLGEGRILDGCITCPWHGWQYRPEDGRSPPPFQEVVETYPVRIENGFVLVAPRAEAAS